MKDNDVIFPLYSTDLAVKLDEMYPESCPDMDDNDRTVWFKAGQRDVVRFILEHKRRAEEDDLTNEMEAE